MTAGLEDAAAPGWTVPVDRTDGSRDHGPQIPRGIRSPLVDGVPVSPLASARTAQVPLLLGVRPLLPRAVDRGAIGNVATARTAVGRPGEQRHDPDAESA